MANPFYVPPKESVMDKMSRFAPFITAIKDLKLRPKEMELRTRMQDETERANRADESIRSESNMLKGQANMLTAADQGIKSQRLEHDRAQAPYHRQTFGPGDMIKMKTVMARGLQDDVKYFAGPLKFFEDLSNQGLTKGDVAMSALKSWPYLQQEFIGSIQKRFEARQKANPAFADTPEGQQMIESMNAISADRDGMQTIGGMFGNTLTSMADEERLRRAEIEAKQESAAPKLYDTTEGWQPAGQAVGKLKPRSGMEIISADGTIIRTGIDPGKFTKPTQTKIEQGSMDTADELSRLMRIKQSFKPEFLEIATRWDNFKTKIKEKLGFQVPEEDKASLKEFTVFRRQAIENINMYIKRITGAQMSEAEAARLTKAMPNAGNGIFDGDSPTEFMAKTDDVLSTLRMASARYNYYRNQGFSELEIKNMLGSNSALSLDDVPTIMNQRANEIGEQLEANNPDLDAYTIRGMVKRQVAEEFGLVQ